VYQVVLNKNKMFKSVGIQLIQSDLSNKTKSKMLKNPILNLEELEKNVEQLLKEALEEQKIPLRRVGVKVSELSDIRDQSSITSYF
jgi:DNA polymerase IV (DinB-like DNA polymerase)